MHTPGHALINLATLGSIVGHEGAVIAGAIVPDLPIFFLYIKERLRGTKEEVIWSVCYQHPAWLAIIHGAHSIPISAFAATAAWLLGMPALSVFFTSVLLHALSDFPVHAIDAHRHFLPFSDFRFQSPLSYWDPRFHGRWVALAEALLVLACSIYIATAAHFRHFLGPISIGLLILVNLGYARSYWRNFCKPAAPEASK